MTGFPFTAVLGMDDLRLALLLNAVSPAIGGVLVRGEKGTAKSTAVRALAALLPPVEVVAGCRFSCDPAAPDPRCPDGPHPEPTATARPARLVELPVGASEDRVVGSLDLERALVEGVRAFEPGLLAAAHRGVLYVDEVNLLHDHLVDLLLDAAAMGEAHVEREGVSVRHPARFLLVGTMNPEEGELRPQLLDRFGLTVEVAATRDPAERADVVRRRLAFDADSTAFAADWRQEEIDVAARIVAARALLAEVVLPDRELRRIAEVCAAFDVDGLRADIVTARTAVTHAAWCGRREVTADDVRAAARLALPHRRRRNPFDAPGIDEQALDDALARADEAGGPDEPPPPGAAEESPESGGQRHEGDAAEAGGREPGQPEQEPAAQGGQPEAPAAQSSEPEGAATPSGEPDDSPSPGAEDASAAPDGRGGPGSSPGPTDEQPPAPAAAPFRPRLLQVPGVGQGEAGRRSRARTDSGRTSGARVPSGGRVGGVHLLATLRAAAPQQPARGRYGRGLVLRREDLRERVREGRETNLVLFVVDASGSMAARARMQAVKGAVLSLLLDAYQRRDKVGLVTFRGQQATLALPPTSSVDAAAARLRELPTGGRTPLAAGLLRAHEVLRVERLRDARRRALLVVVTDGRATAGADPVGNATRAARLLAAGGIESVVVDCESGPVRLGLARRLAVDLGGAPVHPLEELGADRLTAVVRDRRPASGPDRGAA